MAESGDKGAGGMHLADEKLPSVTVVIPAYNAAATLRETLASVAAQDLDDYELLIIDDGSTDTTQDIAKAYVAADARARLIVQANGGVARARNRGLAEARARWVAPVDADDIWHPQHLSRLLAAARSAGDGPALVFAQSRHIDVKSNILLSPGQRHVAGPALVLMALRNIVGNGSALLLHRDAALTLGGYDCRLRDAGAEGCEDYLLQLRMAAHHPVIAVDTYSVGYRQLPGGMSKNTETMRASQVMARRLLLDEEPKASAVPPYIWRWAAGGRELTLFRNRMRRGRVFGALAALARAMTADPTGCVLNLGSDARRVFARMLGYGRGRKARYRHFLDAEPHETGIAMFDALVSDGAASRLMQRRQHHALALSCLAVEPPSAHPSATAPCTAATA